MRWAGWRQNRDSDYQTIVDLDAGLNKSLALEVIRFAELKAVGQRQLPRQENMYDNPMPEIEAHLVSVTPTLRNFSDATLQIHAAMGGFRYLEGATFWEGRTVVSDDQKSVTTPTSAGKLEVREDWAHLHRDNGTHLELYNATTSQGSLEANVIRGLYAEAFRLRQVPPVAPGDLMRAMASIPRLTR